MRGSAMILGAVLWLCASGCKHDLNALRSGGTKASGLRDAGTPAQLTDSGAPTAGDGGGTGGTGGSGSGVSGGACESCDPVPDASVLQLRSCCLGVIKPQCGLTFGNGAVCLQRNVPGQADAGCPSAMARSMTLDGCCRPDGHCGLNAPNFGIGCGTREDLLVQLGAPMATAVACKYNCNTDDDCSAVPGYVCAEDPKDTSHKRRICLKTCLRDPECPKDEVCGLGNDIAGDRALAFCQPPIGSVAPGSFCSMARDCVNGVCVQAADRPNACSVFCVNRNDCSNALGCHPLSVASLKGTSSATFKVCQPP